MPVNVVIELVVKQLAKKSMSTCRRAGLVARNEIASGAVETSSVAKCGRIGCLWRATCSRRWRRVSRQGFSLAQKRGGMLQGKCLTYTSSNQEWATRPVEPDTRRGVYRCPNRSEHLACKAECLGHCTATSILEMGASDGIWDWRKHG
jgi:hypothetical protein